MKQNFIRTTDGETAEQLVKLGFQKIDESNGIYVFLNCGKKQFEENLDKSKIQYTNILCV